PLTVAVAARELEGRMRGQDGRLFHLVVNAAQDGYAAVLALDEAGKARGLHPDPNPLLRDLVRAQKLRAGTPTRVPAGPSLHFQLAESERRMLVIVRPMAWKAGDLERLSAEIGPGDSQHWLAALRGKGLTAATCDSTAK